MSLFSIFKAQMIFLNIQQNSLIFPWNRQLPARSLLGISCDPNTVFCPLFSIALFKFSFCFSFIVLTLFTKFSFSSVQSYKFAMLPW